MILDIVFRSASGRSLLQNGLNIESHNLAVYAATEETQKQAIQELQKLGFEMVGPASPYGISISGPPQLVREVFGEGELIVPNDLSRWIEAARIPPPGEFYAY